MSTTKVRLDLTIAQGLADRLVEMLKPACERIEVAGSIRRKKSTVGDIELVVIPRVVETFIPAQLDMFGEGTAATVKRDSKLDELLAGLVKRGEWYDTPPMGLDARPAWGEKYKKAWVREPETGELIQVDIFAATSQNWGAIFTIRTGPAEFGHEMQTHILYKTPYRQQDGVLIVQETGEVVPVPEEADYFRLAGVPFIRPESRTVGALKHAIAQARQQQPAVKLALPKPNGKTVIANIRALPDDWRNSARYIYIGRANQTWRVPESKWHNPFPGHQYGRDRAIQLYRDWLEKQPDLLRAVPELVGKVLVCWCAPKPCHGDVLATLANAYAGGRWRPGVPLPWIEYTCDDDVRAQIRARLEAAAGLTTGNVTSAGE